MDPTPCHIAGYTVKFRALDGSAEERRVITNRGEAKAVFLATRAVGRLVRGFDALDVEVTDDGPPSLDSDGLAHFGGFGFDRNEW